LLSGDTKTALEPLLYQGRENTRQKIGLNSQAELD
jgi:hypothetical protein